MRFSHSGGWRARRSSTRIPASARRWSERPWPAAIAVPERVQDGPGRACLPRERETW